LLSPYCEIPCILPLQLLLDFPLVLINLDNYVIQQMCKLLSIKIMYILFAALLLGKGNIYFKRCMDNGTTFGSTENLSNNPCNSTDAEIQPYISWGKPKQ